MVVQAIKIEPESIEAIPVEIGPETFHAYPIGVMPYMEFLRKTRDAKDDESAQGVAMFELFETSMEPEEYARFQDYARNPRHGISVRVMLELITALVERSANRPTEPSAPSPNGETTTGDGS